MGSIVKQAGWVLLALLGAFALGTIALARGETINALWIVVAAIAVYMIGFRFYAQFIANRVMQLDANRATPAIGSMTVSISYPPISTCCSATTSRRSLAQAPWSGRY